MYVLNNIYASTFQSDTVAYLYVHVAAISFTINPGYQICFCASLSHRIDIEFKINTQLVSRLYTHLKSMPRPPKTVPRPLRIYIRSRHTLLRWPIYSEAITWCYPQHKNSRLNVCLVWWNNYTEICPLHSSVCGV